MDEGEKLELEQLEHVSGGGSQSEENSDGFRKTCPLCDTFPGVQRLGITEMEDSFLMKLNICAAVAAGHFGNRFIVHHFAAAEGPAPLYLCAGNRNGARHTP